MIDDAETLLTVGDESTLLEVIADSAAHNLPLEVTGGASKRGLGRPVDGGRRLDLAPLHGVIFYEPDELVLSAKAATPLATILELLDKAGQMLAFDPPRFGGDGGNARQNTPHNAVGGTLGGVFATNLSGSRRLTAGAARDYLLGFKAISGRGEAFQSGSRVMKNVTGYDLCKLMAGSYGTLGVMHEMTVKTMPKPETSATLLYPCTDAYAARGIIRQAFASPHEPAMAALIPAGLAVYSKISAFHNIAHDGVIAALRLEGFQGSVQARSDSLYALAEIKPIIFDAATADALHAEIRETQLLPRQSNRVIWKITCPPEQGAGLLTQLLERPNCRGYADWGGGLIWLSSPAGQHAGAEAIRTLVAAADGEAMLYEAPESLRRSVPVFHPQPPALLSLTKRIKSGFDPCGILNPSRMIEGV